MIQTRYKKDLAGQLGNLLNRSTAKSLLPSGYVPIKTDSSIDPRDEVLHKKLIVTAGKKKINKERFPTKYLHHVYRKF
jgi:methionyl-tRNA synthetase